MNDRLVARARTFRAPFLSFALVVFALTAAGCRQADGEVPTPSAGVQLDLQDVTRDLLNAAGGDPEAPKDLADDIAKYADRRGGQEARELSRRIADVLKGSKLDETSAQRLAHHLWVAVAAKDLSTRQADQLRKDVEELLVSVGVERQRAEGASAQVTELQKAITLREKRWYEVF
jgi:hypothetical protein